MSELPEAGDGRDEVTPQLVLLDSNSKRFIMDGLLEQTVTLLL